MVRILQGACQASTRSPNAIALFVILASIGLGCSNSHPPDGAGDQNGVIVQMSETVNTVATLVWDDAECQGASPQLTLSPAHGTYVQPPDALGELLLFGLHASETYDFEFVLTADGDTCISQTGSFETGALPTTLPNLTPTNIQPDQVTSGYVLSTMISHPSTVIVHDLQGNIVWWYQNDTDGLTSRASLDLTHGQVVYNSFTQFKDTQDTPISALIRINLDGTVEEMLAAENAHHDFCALSDGSIIYLGKTARDFDHLDAPAYADTVEILYPDGGIDRIWDAWDAIPATPEDPHWDSLADSHEWTHANALFCDEEHDEITFSLHNRSELRTIDANTGEELTNYFGRLDSDFVLKGDGQLPSFQHRMQLSDDRLLLFDNGSPSALSSRAVEYSLDPDLGQATQVWEYVHDPETYVYVLGDVARLPDGNRLVVWSTAGEMSIVSPDEEELWRLNTDAGMGFGYSEWIGDLDIGAG